MSGANLTVSEIMAELVVEAIRENVGAVGVMVRDVPPPDPRKLIAMLKPFREEGIEFRIAYLLDGGAEAAAEAGLGADIFSHEIEQAERWRNQRNLDALIIVVALGDEAKLSSLEEFAPVTSRDLKRVLVERALGEEAGQNDVQTRWWRLLGADDGIGLAQLVDYYVALSDKKGDDFVAASSREVFRLGLIPDHELFDDPKESVVRARFEKNRELVVRFQTLTPQDRRTIAQTIGAENDPDAKAQLQEALEHLRRARWESEGMRSIDFHSAERLVKARSRKPRKKGEDPPSRRPPEKAANVAAESLIEHEREVDLETVVEGLKQRFDDTEEANEDESRTRPVPVEILLPDEESKAVLNARTDIINLVGKLLDDGVYGGLIEIEAADFDEVLRRFDAQQHVIARWERDAIDGFLNHLSIDDAGADLARSFWAYDRAREDVLPLVRSLAVEPLVVAASPGARTKLLTLIEAYEAMVRTILDRYEQLFDNFGSDVDELLGHLLLLETIVIRVEERTYAVAAPSHPLVLWHYVKYCQIVSEQQERLDDQDKELVVEAAKNLPNFLTSMFVPPAAFGTGVTLPYLGRLGPLPYFGEKTEASASDDGLETIRRLVEAYLAYEPHSRLGFRLALVDPPSAGAYLNMLAELTEDKQDKPLAGAHLTVYRHPRQRSGIALRLSDDEEDKVSKIFGSLAPERRFTFEVRELLEGEIGPPERSPFHMVVVFDPGKGQANRTRPAAHPIQPLALPRRIKYVYSHKAVELEPASGGPFDSYDKVVKRLAQGGGASYLSVHQDAEMRARLRELAALYPWTVVAGRQVDRDLTAGALRVVTARDGERDVAAFSRSAVAFRRPLREVVRNYNTAVGEDELDDLLVQLSNLLDAGLLSLRPGSSGETNQNLVKGLLGTLIAARWFRESSSSDRLLISLDSPDARRWLRLSNEPLRADLVGFEWTDDHCTVSVIEAKAVQSSSGEYTVTDGVANGPAVGQMLATRRLLAQIFASERDDELITTPARREILREHLYRELAKEIYLPEERRRWAERLQRLLDGAIGVDLRCRLVDVKLGVDDASLQNRDAIAIEDDETSVRVHITQLNHKRLDALVQRAPEEPPEDEESPVEEGSSTPSVVEPVPAETPPETAEQESRPISRGEPDEENEQQQEVNEAHPERVKAFLGTAPGAYGKMRDVWFDPASPEQQLPNPHILVTGETGSGKTQATKAILADLRQHRIPALILDFKDDYSDQTYTEIEGLQVYDPSYESLPFNPLTPLGDPRTGRVNPSYHVHQLADIVKRIYRLGDQQAYRFREAIKRAYEVASIPMRAFEPSPEQTYPPFEVVRAQLDADRGNEALLGRLSPIFDLELFSSGVETGFAKAATTSTVVRLGQLPGDETKNSVAEFFLMALYNYLIRQPQTHSLGRLLVLDEAWRLIESPFLVPLIREGRAFGLGVLVATQFPGDLPDEISGSTATKLFFSQTQLSQIREIQRTVVGKTSGSDADHLAGVLRGLAPLTCVLHSKQHTPFVRVKIKPYFERQEGSSQA